MTQHVPRRMKLSGDSREKIVQLDRAGWSVEDVARRTRTSVEFVCMILRRHYKIDERLARHKNGLSDDDLPPVFRMNMGNQEAAKFHPEREWKV